MSKQKLEWFFRHRYPFYLYIIWLFLNITLLLLGDGEDGFFPFGNLGFNIIDYGVPEFFVYAIFLPTVIYIIFDTIIAVSLLFLFDCIVVFMALRVIFLLIESIWVQGAYRMWMDVFNFSSALYVICFIVCFVLTIILAAVFLEKYRFRSTRYWDGCSWKLADREIVNEDFLIWLLLIPGVGVIIFVCVCFGCGWAYLISLIVIIVSLLVKPIKDYIRERELIRKHGEVGWYIYNNSSIEGMTKEQCVESYGKPNRVDYVSEEGEEYERLTWARSKDKSIVLLFRDNILIKERWIDVNETENLED